MLTDAIISESRREENARKTAKDNGKELTLTNALEIGQQYELSQRQLKIVRDEEEVGIPGGGST